MSSENEGKEWMHNLRKRIRDAHAQTRERINERACLVISREPSSFMMGRTSATLRKVAHAVVKIGPLAESRRR